MGLMPSRAKRLRVTKPRIRKTAAKRGYGYRWQKTSHGFLAKHPLCAECLRRGRVTAALLVDHVRPHRGNMRVFWDRLNWQALCKACHDAKTARGE